MIIQQTLLGYVDMPTVEKNDCCQKCHYYYNFFKASFCIRNGQHVDNPTTEQCAGYDDMQE